MKLNRFLDVYDCLNPHEKKKQYAQMELRTYVSGDIFPVLDIFGSFACEV